MDACMDKWMRGWLDKWIYGPMDEHMDTWMVTRVHEEMCGCMDEQISEGIKCVLFSLCTLKSTFKINILLAKNVQQSCSQLISPHCTQMLLNSPETSTAYCIKSG